MLTKRIIQFIFATFGVALLGFLLGWAYTVWIQPTRELAQAEEYLRDAPKRIIYIYGSDYPDLLNFDEIMSA